MFCHNCGAPWPDGTKFCGKCGTVLTGDTPQQMPDEDATVAVNRVPVPSDPVVPVPEPAVEPADEIDKTVKVSNPVPARPQPAPVQYQQQYYQAAPKPPKNPNRLAKPLSVMIVITMLISLALLGWSGYTMLETNVTDMGVITWSLDTLGIVDLEDEIDKLDRISRKMDKALKDEDSQMKEGSRKYVKELSRNIENLQTENSISDLIDFAKYLSDSAEDLKEHVDIKTEAFAPLIQAESLLYIVIVALYFLPALFALLGGLLKNTGLTVTALILTLLVQLLFSTHSLLLFSLGVYALQILMCVILRKSKKRAKLAA